MSPAPPHAAVKQSARFTRIDAPLEHQHNSVSVKRRPLLSPGGPHQSGWSDAFQVLRWGDEHPS